VIAVVVCLLFVDCGLFQGLLLLVVDVLCFVVLVPVPMRRLVVRSSRTRL